MSDAHAVAAPQPQWKDTLGCQASQLTRNIEFDSGDVRYYRKTIDHEHLERVIMPANDRGFLVGVSLNGGHKRNIFKGRHAVTRHFESNSIYIRNFSEDYRADLYGNFDFLLVELSCAFFSRLSGELDIPEIAGLRCDLDQKDAVLGHLAGAVVGNLEMRGPLAELFVEQMSLAIGTHLAHHYGNARTERVRARGTLSGAHEALAKELLLQKTREEGSIAEIASACNLSRGYFIRAFSRTTGRTPHQWLLEQRVAKARDLIRDTGMSLSEIAILCGFSDQSHLNRVFLRATGTSPGVWRRNAGR
jgi:AraC-like DNA-binding protein